MDDTATRDKLAEDAARAARAASEEAPTPAAKRFLREHANFLARMAAARRRGVREPGRMVVAVVPLLQGLPA
jgi:F0F1-type ATP synthase membrane subunit b/b'